MDLRSVYRFVQWTEWILNTTVNGGNPVDIEQLDGAGAVLQTTSVTSLLPCPVIPHIRQRSEFGLARTGTGATADANQFGGAR